MSKFSAHFTDGDLQEAADVSKSRTQRTFIDQLVWIRSHARSEMGKCSRGITPKESTLSGLRQ